MPKLLVGSVFTDSDRTPKWLELQLKFLKQTTEDYRHVVYLTGDVPRDIFTESEIIGSYHEGKQHKRGFEQSRNHALGLRAILEYFRSHEADNYLLLDSDCFPVMGWQENLLRKMGDKQYAAAVRTENLDIFPHPCVVFFKGSAIKEPWINLGVANNVNLLYQKISDNGCGMPMSKCYPLIKSNVYSPHPMFATVYNHMFYHHAAGSRDLMPRSVLTGYFDHYMTADDHRYIKEKLYRELCDNPDRYVNKLMGRILT